MITIAPKSSIIAKAVKKTFKDNGTLFPNRESTPKENAISVADGIAQPFIVSLSPKLKSMNKLAAFILFTSQGIPLFHQGQEWGHSKIIAETKAPDLNVHRMDPNSYNKDNETNWVNWNELSQNQDLVNFYKALIQIRKEYPQLRNNYGQ